MSSNKLNSSTVSVSGNELPQYALDSPYSLALGKEDTAATGTSTSTCETPTLGPSGSAISTRATTSWIPSNSTKPASSNKRRASRSLATAVSRSRPQTSTGSLHDISENPTVICAVTESRGASPTVGMAYIDLSTSRAILCQIADNQTYTRTVHKLWIWEPTVLLVPSTAASPYKSKLVMFLEANPDVDAYLIDIDRKYFNERDGQEYISQLALSDDIDSTTVAVEGKYYAVACMSAALQYVQYIMSASFAPHSLRVTFEPSEGSMMVDISTIRSLELVQNLREHQSKDCLFGLVNEARTAMGSRLLRSNILQPIIDADVLCKRFDAVDELLSKEKMFVAIRSSLQGFPDVDRALTDLVIVPGPKRLEEWSIQNINRILILKKYIVSAKTVYVSLGTAESDLLRQICEACGVDAYGKVEDLIASQINEDASYSRKPEELELQRIYAVKAGTNGLLDVARQIYRETLDDVHELREHLEGTHGFSISLAFDKKRGYYLKIPISELEHQTLDKGVFIHAVRSKKNVECQTMQLVQLNNKLSCSKAEAMNMSANAVQSLIEKIRVHIAPLFRMSDSIALLDVLSSFAHVSSVYDYVKPRLGSTIAIKAARHPIRIKVSSSTFIPNDCYAAKSSRLQIVTGCNMSGKSTYIRTIALLQIMAQIGCFVPAEYASFCIRHQICARISTDDNLSANVSTFASEMREMAFILRNIDQRSLVIVDELGRGTSTTDGLAIAVSIAEALLESRANVWFVTHFHELATFLSGSPGVTNLHLAVEIREDDRQLLMLYKIASGPVEKTSYGITVARVLNLPANVLAQAEVVSELLKQKRRCSSRMAVAAVQTEKRKLFYRLKDQLLFARESGVDGEELRVWLKSVQDDFVIRLDLLQREEERLVALIPDSFTGIENSSLSAPEPSKNNSKDCSLSFTDGSISSLYPSTTCSVENTERTELSKDSNDKGKQRCGHNQSSEIISDLGTSSSDAVRQKISENIVLPSCLLPFPSAVADCESFSRCNEALPWKNLGLLRRKLQAVNQQPACLRHQDENEQQASGLQVYLARERLMSGALPPPEQKSTE